MRFEQHGFWVLLEDATGRSFHVPRGWLPADIRERDSVEVEEQFTPGAHALHISVRPPGRAEKP
jgi:hypothetical protein